MGPSFEQPVECMESIAGASMNLLEMIHYLDAPVRLFNACSLVCFGETGREPANVATLFRTRSQNNVANATAFWQMANYREAYASMHATPSWPTTNRHCSRTAS